MRSDAAGMAPVAEIKVDILMDPMHEGHPAAVVKVSIGRSGIPAEDRLFASVHDAFEHGLSSVESALKSRCEIADRRIRAFDECTDPAGVES